MLEVKDKHFEGGQNLSHGTRKGDDSILEELVQDGKVKSASGGKTTSREENVDGLSSAIALANSLKSTMNDHAADAVEHGTSADAVNFPVSTPDADSIVTLIELVTNLMTAYVAHNADALLGSGWAFHNAQQLGNTLASVVAPTNLQECITRLNDLKAKYNTHESSATSHTVGSAHTEAEADAAYGAAIKVDISEMESTDSIVWSILDAGTGTVKGVSAVAYSGYAIFTFSADPQNDCIISYCAIK